MPRDTFHARVRPFTASLLIALTLTACTPATAPPRSPFDDRGPAPTAPPGVTSFPPPFAPPTLTPTATSSPSATPSVTVVTPSGAAEAAVGVAIEALAGRMAVSAARLSLVSVEAVDWPDGCLGVALPGMMCTQVITPGYRVVLRYDTRSTHEVHTGRGGAVAWKPQSMIHATVQQGEQTNSALSLKKTSGEVVAVLLAPGTQRLGLAGALKAGDRVVLGVDDVNDGSPLRAAWIAPE